MWKHEPRPDLDPEIDPCTLRVGRKLQTPRPAQAAKLVALRKAAGLSQAELAKVVGVPQANIAYWERSEKPPRSDVLPKLADALGVSNAAILDVDAKATPRTRAGGQVQQAFDEVRRLPRRQQRKVVEFVFAFVNEHKRKAG